MVVECSLTLMYASPGLYDSLHYTYLINALETFFSDGPVAQTSHEKGDVDRYVEVSLFDPATKETRR